VLNVLDIDVERVGGDVSAARIFDPVDTRRKLPQLTAASKSAASPAHDLDR
jgi:hypothetical protein